MQVGVLFTRRNRTCLAFAMAGLLVAACDSGGSIDEVTAPEIALNRNGQPKVLVCHVSSEDGTIVLIATGNPANHIGNPAHTFNAVSDYDPTGVGKKDSDGNGIADGCEIEKIIFAIAYTNVDGQPGFDESAGDLLIAKLVDESGDGVPGSGDVIITDSYPLDDVVTGRGSFTVTTHSVANCPVAVSGLLECTAASGAQFVFEDANYNPPFNVERYVETEPGSGTDITYIIDSHVQTVGQEVAANSGSPSHPDTDVYFFSLAPTDDSFLDIDFFLPMS